MKLPRSIYAIQHNVTKRIYVGSSCRPYLRCQNHMCLLKNNKHSVEDMQDDFNKFGSDYSFFILETITEYKERRKEYEWMLQLQSHIRGKGYNYKENNRIKELKNEKPIKFIKGVPKSK